MSNNDNNNGEKKRGRGRPKGVRNKEETWTAKIVVGLSKIKTLETAPTYEEFGMSIGYIPRKANRGTKMMIKEAFTKLMLQLKKIDNRVAYEMYAINGEWRIVPYAIDQNAIDKRLHDRSKTTIGTIHGEFRALELYRLEGKKNPKYNKRRTIDTENEIKEEIAQEASQE